MNMYNSISVFFISIFLLACSGKVGRSIGMVETMPDEYQVTKAKPLEVPPHYELVAIEETHTN